MQLPPPNPDGSFAIHKINIPGAQSRCSAYYSADGTLLDAEFIYQVKLVYASRPVRGAKARQFLSELGKRRKPKTLPLP